MSGSERQRRYLERRLRGASTDTALKAELAQAKAHIATLEQSIAKWRSALNRAKNVLRQVNEREKHFMACIAELEQELASERERKRAAATRAAKRADKIPG